jgi:hypothetical protein
MALAYGGSESGAVAPRHQRQLISVAQQRGGSVAPQRLSAALGRRIIMTAKSALQRFSISIAGEIIIKRRNQHAAAHVALARYQRNAHVMAHISMAGSYSRWQRQHISVAAAFSPFALA